MVSVSLSDATREVARRDRVLAKAIARLGPIEHSPRDPDGPFGTLAPRDRLPAAGGPGRASDLHARQLVRVLGARAPPAFPYAITDRLPDLIDRELPLVMRVVALL